MTSRYTAERPPKIPGPNGMSFARQNTGGSYVKRFKIQKERIKALHTTDDEQQNIAKNIDQSLPKISQPISGAPREAAGIKKFIRSTTLDKMKLPGVSSGSSYAQVARRRQPVPVKTFQMKLNPDHVSYISKSLPSLPSIPGSPSQDQGVSPASERHHEFKAPAFPSHGRHRYQKIAFQKTLHTEKNTGDSEDRIVSDYPSKDIACLETIYSAGMPRRAHRHKHRAANEKSNDPDREDIPPKSNSTLSHARHRRYSKESNVTISDTRSEGNYFTAKKWKDNCECLRCQMLRRQFKEGDEHYTLWGQYPCHNVDPSVSLDNEG